MVRWKSFLFGVGRLEISGKTVMSRGLSHHWWQLYLEMTIQHFKFINMRLHCPGSILQASARMTRMTRLVPSVSVLQLLQATLRHITTPTQWNLRDTDWAEYQGAQFRHEPCLSPAGPHLLLTLGWAAFLLAIIRKSVCRARQIALAFNEIGKGWGTGITFEVLLA